MLSAYGGHGIRLHFAAVRPHSRGGVPTSLQRNALRGRIRVQKLKQSHWAATLAQGGQASCNRGSRAFAVDDELLNPEPVPAGRVVGGVWVSSIRMWPNGRDMQSVY